MMLLLQTPNLGSTTYRTLGSSIFEMVDHYPAIEVPLSAHMYVIKYVHNPVNQ